MFEWFGSTSTLATRPVVRLGPSDRNARPFITSAVRREVSACWPYIATPRTTTARRTTNHERFIALLSTLWDPGGFAPEGGSLALTVQLIVLVRQRNHLERLRRTDRRERLADELAEHGAIATR